MHRFRLLVPAVLAVIAVSGCFGGGTQAPVTPTVNPPAGSDPAGSTPGDEIGGDVLQAAAKATLGAPGATRASVRLFAGQSPTPMLDLSGSVDFTTNTASFAGTLRDGTDTEAAPVKLIMADRRVFLELPARDGFTAGWYELAAEGAPSSASDYLVLGGFSPALFIATAANLNSYSATRQKSTDGTAIVVFDAGFAKSDSTGVPMLFRYAADRGGSIRAVVADGYVRQVEYTMAGTADGGGVARLRFSVGDFAPVTPTAAPTAVGIIRGAP